MKVAGFQMPHYDILQLFLRVLQGHHSPEDLG